MSSTTSGSGSGGLPGGLGPQAVKPAVTPLATTIDASMVTPDGRTRTYHLYVPTTVKPGTGGSKVPLLVALHGGVGWGTQFEKNSGFDGLAQANGFIVVYPDGIGIGRNANLLRTWNGGGCCGQAVKQQVDDVGFIRLLIQRIEAQYPIDQHRVFAAGHSNGGILAYRLACELSDQIVAIGVQSSALEVSSCHPSQPVSVLHIHGTADQNIPIDGGYGPNAISGVSFNRPIDGATTLAAADGCAATPTVEVDPSNRDLTVHAWSSCHGRTEVEFVTVAGASHAWMGHAGGAARKLVGPPYMKLDSSLAIWTFLANHPRP
jgi:polyhydroxybutyrate depolymerase